MEFSEEDSAAYELIELAEPAVPSLPRADGPRQTDNASKLMYARITELEEEVRSKDRLCRTLQTSLERILATSNAAATTLNYKQAVNAPTTCRDGLTAVIGLSSARGVNEDTVTTEHFRDTLAEWRNQVWFSKQLPIAVEATFEKLISRLVHMFEIEGRRTALTMQECFSIVDQDVRSRWEKNIPPGIVRGLTLNTSVHASHADAKMGVNGQQCKAVHFLVYFVHKLYNRSSQLLLSQKRKEAQTISTKEYLSRAGKSIEVLDTGLQNTAASSRLAPKLKWYNNPSMTQEVDKCTEALQSTAFSNVISVETLLSLTVAKLINNNKPPLAESLEYLASIIALTALVARKSWKINRKIALLLAVTVTLTLGSILQHRAIFQFKIMELWHRLHQREGWNQYVINIWGCLHSLLAYAFICRGKGKLVLLFQSLEALLKSVHRKEYLSAIEQMNIDNNFEAMFLFLQSSVKVCSDYYAFYPKAFVFLLQFIGVIEDTKVLPESVLLNLLVDIPICKDVTKLSSLEAKDYVKVISVLSTCMMDALDDFSYFARSAVEGERKKYLEAAAFLGNRLTFLLKVNLLTKEEQSKFWNNSEEGYNLLDYCGEEETVTLKRSKLQRLDLPDLPAEDISVPADAKVLHEDADAKVLHQEMSDDEPPNELTHELGTSSRNSRKTIAARPGDATLSLNGLKVDQLRKILAEKGLPTSGKKTDLQRRLSEFGGYVRSKRASKKRSIGEVNERGDSDSDSL